MKRWHGHSSGVVLWKDATQALSIICLLLVTQAHAYDILPAEGISLTRDIYEADDAVCGNEAAIRAVFDTFGLPTSSQAFAFLVNLDGHLDPSSDGVLMNLKNVVLKMDVSKGMLIMEFPNKDTLEYALPFDMNGKVELGILRKSDGAFKICANGVPAQATTLGNAAVHVDESEWAMLIGIPPIGIPETRLVFGDSSSEGKSATTFIQNVLFMNQTMECGEMSTIFGAYRSKIKRNVPPKVKSIWTSPDKAVVGSFVTVSASGEDSDGDDLKIRLTFYGLHEDGCERANCGDLTREKFGSSGSVEIHASVKYPRAGRYVVRVEVADMKGHTITKDHSILVRKVGDTEGRAKCCRHTGMVIALQQGRPIHNTNFRDPSIYSYATDSQFRWSEEYLNTDDLESERLFDFGMLAPAVRGPLKKTTCHDIHVAGAGSPKVLTYTHESRMLGHNKRIQVLTQGLPWGGWNNITIDRPECETHFTKWAETSPYKGESMGQTCSYACTADGVDKLITDTGSYDRLAESVMEVSYGRASLSWDVSIADDIIDLPIDTKTNLFTYHDHPARRYVRNVLKEDNLPERFFQTMVLSPWPHHNNRGQLAWASGTDSFPAIFILRCNPQLYYLIHETGHRFGLPHSAVYKVEDGTHAPTDPLSPGTIEDGYSDKLDIMACCKGSYNLYSRIYAGWVQGHEREHLDKNEVHTENTHRFTIWPFDRSESRGKLMAVTMRLADDKALAFGFRSVPYYQDVKIGRWPSDRKDGILASEDMRHNIRGLSVGYSSRYEKRGKLKWSIRGLLDFNLLYGEWPDALPEFPSSFPPKPAYDAFAQLKEGYPWFHKEEGEDTGVMVMVERLVDCPETPELNEYKYSAKGFYGWRGEFPFQEKSEKHDYTGYMELKCMDLLIKTGVTEDGPPGRLDMRLRFADERAGGIFLHDSCGFNLNPRVEVVLPDDTKLSSIVWKDNLNRTISTDKLSIQLPKLSKLRESSNLDAPECKIKCPDSFSVKVAAEDGRHARAAIRIESNFQHYVMHIRYTHYDSKGFHFFDETQKVYIVKKFSESPQAPRGIKMFGDETWPTLQAHPMKVDVTDLPVVQCSKQWTITFLLKVDELKGIANIFSIGRIPHSMDSSMPLVQISSLEDDQHQLVIHWQSDQYVLDISQQLNPSKDLKKVHIKIVRDGDELGAWVNGQGKWFPGTVWCIPSRQDILFCDHEPVGSGFSWGQDTGMWIGDLAEGFQGGVRFLRVYNYAIPQGSWKDERDCPENLHTEFFMIQKEAATVIKDAPTSPSIAREPNGSKRDSPRFVWKSGHWGSCSKHCGGGHRTRSVTCMDSENMDGDSLPSEFCIDVHRPARKEECNQRACTPHKLLIGESVKNREDGCNDLPECGIQDGGGVQCRSNAGYLVPAWECNIRTFSDFAAASIQLESPRSQKCEDLAAQCTSQASLFSWKMSTWSKCSRTCGGGVQTRDIICTAEGMPVESDQCIGLSKKGFEGYELSRACNSQPCQIHTWQVTEWEDCHGEQIGYSFRNVRCTDKIGKTSADDLCLSKRPADEELCLVDEASARCRPLNSAPDDPDCSGNGQCTFLGCHCMNGHHGSYCQTPPECLGILGKGGECCENGIIDTRGRCCSGGDAVLDNRGLCCDSGKLDACGVCNGKGKAVDILGLCCSSGLLDNSGVCCQSGLVDECGVCDGDSTSCAISLTLSFLAVKSTPGSDPLQADASASPNLTPAEWEAFTDAITNAISDTLSVRSSGVITSPIHSLDETAEPALATSVKVENRVVSRRLSQSPVLNGELAINVLILPDGEASLSVRDIFTKLEPYIQSQNGFQAKDAQNSVVPVLLNVRDVFRSGICGNGVCEVGEQEAYPAGVKGTSGCPEDCQFSVQLCPSPGVGGIGVKKAACGLNGICHVASGTCDCFAGYSGDACDTCSPGYTKSSGLCQKLYINGTWVNSRLPTFAIETHLDDVIEADDDSMKGIWLAVGCVGALTICSILLLLILLRKRRRRQYMAGGSSRASRSTTYPNQGQGIRQEIQYGVPNTGVVSKIAAKQPSATMNHTRGDGSPQIRVVSIPQRNYALAKDVPTITVNPDLEEGISAETMSRLQRLSSVLETGHRKLERRSSLAEDKLGSIKRVSIDATGSTDENLRAEIDIVTSVGRGWSIEQYNTQHLDQELK